MSKQLEGISRALDKQNDTMLRMVKAVVEGDSMIYEYLRGIILLVLGVIMMTISWLMWRRQCHKADENMQKRLDELRQYNSR